MWHVIYQKLNDIESLFKDSILPLWIPVFIVLGLILPANFSTAALIFSMVILLTFLGGYPLKYLSVIIGSGLMVLDVFCVNSESISRFDAK